MKSLKFTGKGWNTSSSPWRSISYLMSSSEESLFLDKFLGSRLTHNVYIIICLPFTSLCKSPGRLQCRWQAEVKRLPARHPSNVCFLKQRGWCFRSGLEEKQCVWALPCCHVKSTPRLQLQIGLTSKFRSSDPRSLVWADVIALAAGGIPLNKKDFLIHLNIKEENEGNNNPA